MRSFASTERAADVRAAAVGGVVGLLVAYVMVTYRGAVLEFYFLDDWWVMRDGARACGGTGWPIIEIFRPGPAGLFLFRPLTTGAYACVLRALFGYDPSGHHFAQLVAFAANSALVLLIVRRLTQSIVAGLAAGLLYAAAPGQVVGVYWLSAFTVSGTALFMLLLAWSWLTLRGWSRVVACTALQLAALLASEHAVVGPILLAALSAAAAEREPWRRTGAALLGPAAVTAVYATLKVLHGIFVRRPPAAYALTLDPTVWVRHLGQYFATCFDALALLQMSGPALTGLGVGLIGFGLLAMVLAVRPGGAWRLVAAGWIVFAVSLVPVLGLKVLFRDHYIGLAATGMAMMVVGVCQALLRGGQWLALGVAVASVVLGIQTEHRSWRANEIFRLVHNGSELASGWIGAMQAAPAGAREVLVRSDKATQMIFIVGQAEAYFPGLPARVVLYDQAPQALTSGQVIIAAPAPRRVGQPHPGWSPRWSWLRRLAGGA